jgi:hypothetical protein
VQSLAAREAKVSLDLVDLLRGRITIDALRLLKPHITLRDSTIDAAAPANAKTLFTTLLGGAPVRVLHVRKGRIMLPGERGGTIKEIYAHLDAGKETGAVSGFGSFTYKDTTVRYSLESGSVTPGRAESFPLATLTLRRFRAGERHRVEIAASPSTATCRLRSTMGAFFKWIDIRVPDGDSLKGSRQRERPSSGSTLTFDDRSRSTATRLSACLRDRGDPRPRVEGTLAFDRLARSLSRQRQKRRQTARRTPAPFPFNRPLLIHRRRSPHLCSGDRSRRAEARAWRLHNHRKTGVGGERSW